MGKIYEALNRDQNADDVLDLFDEDGEGQEEQEQFAQEPNSEGFSFIRYSLGATSLVPRERPAYGLESNSLAPRSLTRPGRELTVAAERLDPHLVALNNFDRTASQQYNKLALSLISKSAERGSKRVLLASAGQGDGRTCVTLNLACALARARQRVLVADCDLLNPSIMRTLGLHSEIGMYEAFDQGLPPSALAVSIRPYGFNVLPTTRPIENPAELFAMPGFWRMLQAFDGDHDFILFDSSPLTTGGDSSLLVRFTDATLLVVRSGHTSSAQMAKAMAPFAPEDILGVVINRMSN